MTTKSLPLRESMLPWFKISFTRRRTTASSAKTHVKSNSNSNDDFPNPLGPQDASVFKRWWPNGCSNPPLRGSLCRPSPNVNNDACCDHVRLAHCGICATVPRLNHNMQNTVFIRMLLQFSNSHKLQLINNSFYNTLVIDSSGGSRQLGRLIGVGLTMHANYE